MKFFRRDSFRLWTYFPLCSKVGAYPKKLEAPLEMPAQDSTWIVPYSLIDGALHSLIGFHAVGKEGENEAPYCFRDFYLYGKFSKTMQVLAYKFADFAYRLEFYNEENELIAEFKKIETVALTRAKKKVQVNQISHFNAFIKGRIGEVTDCLLTQSISICL